MGEIASDVYSDLGGPLVVVVSGPSGVGKDAVFRHMKELDRNWYFVVTATTRPRRRNERNGVDYFFLDEEEFGHLREGNQFLECARVYDNWYGVVKQQVKDALVRGQDVLIKLDTQGAATVKRIIPESVTIFLAPPSIEELNKRLRLRKSESLEAIKLRASAAPQEMECMETFEYRVINYDKRLDLAVFCIDSIISAEKCRIPSRGMEIDW